MANLKKRRDENVSGAFFVDSTCIDCGTCYWMAPKTFRESKDQSAVFAQPQSDEDKRIAAHALLACPTSSIGDSEKTVDLKIATLDFPLTVHENVFHCGFHSEASFGATAYLIKRRDGNVLVDSPRFVAPLVKKLEELGGIRFLYLTHKDDVADHQKFRDHFKCDRILHQDDLTPQTKSIEMILQGGDEISIAPDLTIIPVPGHTKGHTVLLYNDMDLFTGDHMAWSEKRSQLVGFRDACWYSWEEQIKSMQRLTSKKFSWVLPGHGVRYHADPHDMQTQLQKCISWMKTR